MVEVGQSLVDAAEEFGAQVFPGRVGRIRGPIENHHAAVDPDQGQQEIRRDAGYVGKAVDEKRSRRQCLRTTRVELILGELQRLGRSPDTQIVGMLENLRCEPNQRAGPLDTYRRSGRSVGSASSGGWPTRRPDSRS